MGNRDKWGALLIMYGSLATIFLAVKLPNEKTKGFSWVGLSGLNNPDSEHDDVLYADHV